MMGDRQVPYEPHNPIGPNYVGGEPCNICYDMPWPCPIRQAARTANREIVAMLRSDLYEREPSGDTRQARWVSPLGWAVVCGYSVAGLYARIEKPDGDTLAEADPASVGWLEANLP